MAGRTKVAVPMTSTRFCAKKKTADLHGSVEFEPIALVEYTSIIAPWIASIDHSLIVPHNG
jgi:hypothetical protein